MGKPVTLKGGIIGCGWVTNISHIPAFRALKGVEIVAVCDQDENAARKTARRWGIGKAHKDLSRLLAEEKLDFIDICSPPRTHPQLSVQAMQAGLHVLVEKPMAITVSEADEMLSVSKKNNVKLCVVHNMLFSPVIQKARALVDAGDIGDLVSVDYKALFPGERILSKQDDWRHRLPSGILVEWAPHAVYLESAFLGNINAIKVTAKRRSTFPWVRADELKVLLEARNGLGTFTISCNSPRYTSSLDIFGTRKSLHLDNYALTMIQRQYRGVRADQLLLDQINSSLQALFGAAAIVVNTLAGQRWYKSGHQALIKGFLESIRNDTDPPVTGEDGRQTLKILDDIAKQII